MTKYRIVQDNSGSRTVWLIKQGTKTLSHHMYKSDAESTVQRYIAEDRDFAMEGR